MPVNTAALKTFAPAMRRQLLEAVGRKLDLLLNSQTPDTLSTYAKQIAELREQEAENREQLLERVAYTWFNRLCALRYLDAKGWHPFGCKVLMPAAEGETQPELLKLMRAGSLPGELKVHTNEARLHGLLDGLIPPAMSGSDPQGEVYRELVLASCRSYHQLLPDLFEGLDDASELLLPDDLLSERSIAGGFRTAISDEDCEDVEIIGWLYQFYISEKKDHVIGKVVKSEDIPAATQLFTPNWIVKYMVQNTLGATWLTTYPDSPLRGEMEFYIEPAEQAPEVQAQLAVTTPDSLDPEALTLIDPACGSGHILVEAYDLLKAIYLERGYRQRDIPALILTKNLYGLDICPRAAQLAAFSLLMKGREDDRRLLDRVIPLNVLPLRESTGFNVERLEASVDLTAAGLSRADLRMIGELFAYAKIFGSLIQVPALLAQKLPALGSLVKQSAQDLFTGGDLQLLRGLVRQATILAGQYDMVVANPPYMGAKWMNSDLKIHVNANYPSSKPDVFAAFVLRSLRLGRNNAKCGFVAPYLWMFIVSYEAFRRELDAAGSIESLVKLEYNSFEPACVPVATFVAETGGSVKREGVYIDLSKFTGPENQAPRAIQAIRSRDCSWRYHRKSEQFRGIPGMPRCFWLSEAALNAFKEHPNIGSFGTARKGMYTGLNEIYVRQWNEVSAKSIGFSLSREQAALSDCKWFPYANGGRYRKWYGNNYDVVLWRRDGDELRNLVDEDGRHRAGAFNLEYIFKPGICWSAISSSFFGVRLLPKGFLFSSVSSAFFPLLQESIPELTGILNSNASVVLINALNPSMHFNAGDVAGLPLSPTLLASDCLKENAARLIELHRIDWDNYELSWDFCGSPLLIESRTASECVETAYVKWLERTKLVVKEAKTLEEESNAIIINSYDLQEDLESSVPDELITLTVNPVYRYSGDLSAREQSSRFQRDAMAELLSYATGCMMGRYSLDQPGLILADSRDNQAEQLAAYEAKVGKTLSEVQFKPDPDGIIPVLDSEWFEDDIVARTREFLEVTFPQSTVTENLRFIEECLGKDIRKYFCSEFYKDHLQTYKKRPIYWMVQSPKKGFSCLIYLHRYTKDTLNQVLNNYFRPYLQKLEARLAQLGLDQLNDDLPTRERTAARKEAEKIAKVLKECQAWEQDALLPLAQQRIELDLDDGVKVNYLKLQDVLAPIPGLAAKED